MQEAADHGPRDVDDGEREQRVGNAFMQLLDPVPACVGVERMTGGPDGQAEDEARITHDPAGLWPT
jgi:hypothetical protein